MANGYDIVCFSHLRWDGVWQRPQQLLTRLARQTGARVFFVEEPLPPRPGGAGWERPEWWFSSVAPGVTRCVPCFDAPTPPFTTPDGADAATIRDLLHELVARQEFAAPVAWVYAPRMAPFLADVGPGAVVYDCMDELAYFKDAPADLRHRETELLNRADVVFTGGRGMYEARLGRHPNLHLFPSSVDLEHFAAAHRHETPVPADARPGSPTLGYYGVLDERLDLGLLDAVAVARPEWSFVLIGPVVKIAPADLPLRPNLHYLGQRAYDDLPGYLRGWDVCLMPFAHNDATRFISPTKTLEYLAADKPVVSTSVRDVVAGYSGIVRFADDPAAFVAACAAALAESPPARQARLAAGRDILGRTSWDATVARMAGLIDETLAARVPPTDIATPRRLALEASGRD